MLFQIADKPITPLEYGGEGLATANRGYYVYMTEACNLRCNYCFVDDKHNQSHLFDPVTYPREADKTDMVAKVVDFVVNDPQGTQSKYVHFFGGEPLIRAKSIDRFATLLMDTLKEKLPGCRVTFGITTNGTLLTDENCLILKKHQVGVQLSLDGSEEGNDVHRQLMGGDQHGGNIGAGAGEGLAKRSAGAFAMVKVDNYLKYFGNNARMTLTPGNLKFLTKSLRELGSRGFKSFSVIPNSDSGAWDGHWQEFEMALEEMFAYASETLGVTINIVDHVWRHLFDQRDQPSSHLCQAGRNVVGISVSGDLWPCHDFLGKYQKDPASVSALQIGHIDQGYTINVEKFEDVKCDDEITSGAGYDCKKCHARSMCERGCPYINYAQHQAVKTVNATYCRSTRITADVALRYMLRHPAGYTVMKGRPQAAAGAPNAWETLRADVATQWLELEAPFGRNKEGQALMPGAGKASELGLKLPSNYGSVVPSAPVGSGPSAQVQHQLTDGNEDSTARWDGEQGRPSPIPTGPGGTTMNMKAERRQTGLAART